MKSVKRTTTSTKKMSEPNPHQQRVLDAIGWTLSQPPAVEEVTGKQLPSLDVDDLLDGQDPPTVPYDENGEPLEPPAAQQRVNTGGESRSIVPVRRQDIMLMPTANLVQPALETALTRRDPREFINSNE